MNRFQNGGFLFRFLRRKSVVLMLTTSTRSAAIYTDLYKFDPMVYEWERSNFSSPFPPPRSFFGFTSDGRNLYLSGGIDNAGSAAK